MCTAHRESVEKRDARVHNAYSGAVYIQAHTQQHMEALTVSAHVIQLLGC